MTIRPKYQIVRHAGEVDYNQWANDYGVEVVVFDKDGTLTEVNQSQLIVEVVEGMQAQDFGDLFQGVAIASNNRESTAVKQLGSDLHRELGIDVVTFSKADGFARKPKPQMGLHIANHFEVIPNQLGVVGDRRLTDVTFGLKLGAGAIALCERQGKRDSFGVPILRALVERPMITVEQRAFRRAA